MFFVAPEMAVLSVPLLARCACVHVRAWCSCRSLQEGGAALKPRGAVGWEATAASVWVVQSLKTCTWRNSWLGGWALQGHSFPTV